ncbi:MAG: ABC transporter substrate-binding protein [Firmicutes bacterium]|nr:ABC transporter substrate-binding protein [Bacillota bacterium]
MKRSRLVFFVALVAFSLLFGLTAGSAVIAKTKITVSVHYGGGQIEPLQKLFQEYMNLHPDVEIVTQTVAFDDYLKKIQTARLSGESPDVYHIYSLWGPSLANAKILELPPAAVANDVKANYIKSAVDGVTINGKIYGIPTEINNYALVYNKKLFKEAGIAAPPKTWDELVQIAQKLAKRDAQGKLTTSGFAFMRGWDSAVVHPFMALLFANGGQFLSKDYAKALFNSPAGVAALEQEVELFKVKATDASSEVWNFPNNTVGMMIMAPWYEGTLKSAYKDKLDEMVGVAPIPAGKKGLATSQYTWLWAVDSNSKVKKEAWELLRWLNKPRANGKTSPQGDFLVGQGIIPGRKADLENHNELKTDPFMKVFVDQLKNSISEPNVLQGAEIKTKLMDEIMSAWAGKKTPKQALDDAAKKVNEILEENY